MEFNITELKIKINDKNSIIINNKEWVSMLNPQSPAIETFNFAILLFFKTITNL